MRAVDLLSAEGVRALLWREPTVELVRASERQRARVVLVVADDLGATVVAQLRAIQRDGLPRIVAVLSRLDADRVTEAAAAGILALLCRSEVTRASLAEAIHQAAQDRSYCPAGSNAHGPRPAPAHPSAPTPASPAGGSTPCPRLSERERQILRLLADGHRTDEVAEQIAYSESTIKVTLARIMGVLGARNRCQAVARALRLGIIR